MQATLPFLSCHAIPQIFREVKLHSSLDHPHIIKLYGAFQQADQVVLVQEFAESGDLFNLLQRWVKVLVAIQAAQGQRRQTACTLPHMCPLRHAGMAAASQSTQP
jgi:serine/threonine protein kinase